MSITRPLYELASDTPSFAVAVHGRAQAVCCVSGASIAEYLRVCSPSRGPGGRPASASPDERGLGTPGHHQPVDSPPHRCCNAGVPIALRAQAGEKTRGGRHAAPCAIEGSNRVDLHLRHEKDVTHDCGGNFKCFHSHAIYCRRFPTRASLVKTRLPSFEYSISPSSVRVHNRPGTLMRRTRDLMLAVLTRPPSSSTTTTCTTTMM